ncbi:MAG: PIG-L family deacetylase [Candidatus Bipolaricaulota bacterium]
MYRRIRFPRRSRRRRRSPAGAPPAEALNALEGPALVVAPHSDDEVLATAGALQRHRALGHRVYVALLTNGDGQYRRPFSNRRLAVQLGYRRQEETLHALSHLGIDEDEVAFLGYPDRGLSALWNTHWSADRPYKSPRTGARSSPYTTSRTPNAPYCGVALAADLEDVLRWSAPATVYLPHPNDLHYDHWAAHSFVMLVLEGMRRREEMSPKLRTYVVHRGRWPLPRGKYLGAPLPPPPALAGLDTTWRALPLSGEERERKFHAIMRHKSQLRYMRRYLVSFARSNELFGRVPRLALGAWLDIADSADRWVPDEGEAPSAEEEPMVSYTDPRRRSLLRDIKRYNDIRALHLQHAGRGRLAIEVELFDRLRPANHVLIHLRAFGEGVTLPASLRLAIGGGELSAASGELPPGAEFAAQPRTVRLELPIEELGSPDSVLVGGELQRNGITFAKAAYRMVDLTTSANRG